MRPRKITETEQQRLDLYKRLRRDLEKGGKKAKVAGFRLKKEFNMKVFNQDEISEWEINYEKELKSWQR